MQVQAGCISIAPQPAVHVIGCAIRPGAGQPDEPRRLVFPGRPAAERMLQTKIGRGSAASAGPYGDCRQDVVLIGTRIGAAALRCALDTARLTDVELAAERLWRSLPTHFPCGKTPRRSGRSSLAQSC